MDSRRLIEFTMRAKKNHNYMGGGKRIEGLRAGGRKRGGVGARKPDSKIIGGSKCIHSEGHKPLTPSGMLTFFDDKT